MNNRIEEFLKSPEYIAWQESFWKLFFNDELVDEELIREFENNHLFSSIKLGSYYFKEKVSYKNLKKKK
ncbi:MAG: hypothetical protein ACPK7O_06735 [Methanobacterium sp.]